MNILSLRQNPLQSQSKPSFQAKPKISQEKLIKGISENLVSSALKAGDTVELSTIINDPKKNKFFFATLGSLMTATAIKITEMLCSKEENPPEKEDIIELPEAKQAPERNKDTKTKEKEKIPKFIKHSGKQGANEKALLKEIGEVIERLNPDIEHKNELISLFNRFCGLNSNGISYDNENNKIPNISISKLVLNDIKNCTNTEHLEEIVSHYKVYTAEKKELVSVSAKEEMIIPDCIATRDNIKESYEYLDKESKANVDNFLVALSSKDNYLQKAVLQKINKRYSESLLGIAEIHKFLSDLSPEQEMDFLTSLSNELIASDAIPNFLAQNQDTEVFNFFEYNSFINRGLSDDAINELASKLREGEISKIILNNFDETFEMELHNTFLGQSFKTILNVFKTVDMNSSRGLRYQDKIYTSDDIDTEIYNNHFTYPLLIKYLTIPNKSYLNRGKEEKLLEIYNGAQLNKDLFTLHSYLRFLERYVMPNLNNEKKIYASQIKNVYLPKLVMLKDALNEAMKTSIKVFVYSIDNHDIKAPKIKIPYGQNGDFFEITINDAGKIHTIF